MYMVFPYYFVCIVKLYTGIPYSKYVFTPWLYAMNIENKKLYMHLAFHPAMIFTCSTLLNMSMLQSIGTYVNSCTILKYMCYTSTSHCEHLHN